MMATSGTECPENRDIPINRASSSQWCKDVTHAKQSLSSCLKSKQKLDRQDDFEITRLIASHADSDWQKTKSGLIYCLKVPSEDEKWECPLEKALSLFLAKGICEDNHCFIIQLGCLIVSFEATRATALVNHCAQHGCGQILKDFWKTLKLTDRNLLFDSINSIDSPVAQHETADQSLAFMLLSCSRFVLLCCGLSSKFCAEFLKADGQKAVVKDLNFKEFERLFVSNICSAKEFVLNCLRIVKCLCRVAAETNQLNLFFDHQLKAVERIMLFLKSSDRDIRLAAFYALVFLASESGENDKGIVLHEIDVLFELFQLFKAAVDDASQLIDRDARSRNMKSGSHHKVSLVLKHWLPTFPHRSRSPAKSNESSDNESTKVLTCEDVGEIQEYLEVLRLAMSFDDAIGLMLFEEIGLDEFKAIIMEHDRWPGCVVVESLACLWQLCFIPPALDRMKVEKDLLSHIQKLQCDCRSDMCTNNEMEEIKEKAAGLMFKLKQVEVKQKYLREASISKMKSSPPVINASAPMRQRSRQSVKMDMRTTAPPKLKESLRRSRGSRKHGINRMTTEPVIPLTFSTQPAQPNFASPSHSLPTPSLESKPMKTVKTVRTVIATEQPKPKLKRVAYQKKTENYAGVERSASRDFTEKNIKTSFEASAATEKSLSSNEKMEEVGIVRTPMKLERSTMEYARAPDSMPILKLAAPVYENLECNKVGLEETVPKENDLVDSLSKTSLHGESDALEVVSLEKAAEIEDKQMSVEEIRIETEVEEYSLKRPYTVMLSYSWNNQEQMKSIRDALKEAGFDVWMDIDNLARGSILMNMAEAVESCDVFVYGVSPAYHKSQACRTEAEYAYTIQKEMIPVKLVDSFKASGWLGILLGNDLYFDISTPEKAVEQIPKLVNAVRVTLNMSRSESTSSSDPETPLKPVVEYSTSYENPPDFADTAGNGFLVQEVNFDLVRDRLVRLLHGSNMPPHEMFPGWNSGVILSDDAILNFRHLNRASPDELLKVTWQAVQNEDEMRKFFLCLELMGALESHNS